MSPNQVSTGVASDFFKLLSRPMTMVTLSTVLCLALFFGIDASHPLLHTCIILILGSLAARSSLAQGPQRWPTSLGAVALGLVALGFGLNYQRAGTLTLSEGERVEAYQRGRGAQVDYHLGGVLRLNSRGDEASLDLIGKDRVTFPKASLKEGLQVNLDDWQFTLVKAERAAQKPVAEISYTQRDQAKATPSQQLTLRSGQSLSPDGQVLISALGISGDRGGANAPQLGAAVELLIKWGQEQQRGWYYVNPPNLDAQWGRAPIVIQKVAIKAGQLFHWRVQRSGTNTVMNLGLALLLVALVLRLFTVKSTVSSHPGSAA